MRKWEPDTEPPLPNFSRDGDSWCALWGADLVQGVAGFGNSPEQALLDFNKRWRTHPPCLPPTSESDG